jgi:hypothetical protein
LNGFPLFIKSMSILIVFWTFFNLFFLNFMTSFKL